MTDRITLRLGPLAQPLIRAAGAAEQTPSEWIRECIAERLRVKPPVLVAGNPTFAKRRRKQG